jgi:BMFP domain-containing protein YqiC
MSNNPFFDDMAKMAGGAFSSLDGVRHEMQEFFSQKFADCSTKMGLVRREELEILQDRLQALEEKLAKLENHSH